MRRTLAAMFTSSSHFCSWMATVVAAGAVTAAPGVESPGVAGTGASHSREANRTADDDERRLLADLERVQRAATEDLNPARFDRDMGAAFLSFGLDLDRVDSKVAAAKLAG